MKLPWLSLLLSAALPLQGCGASLGSLATAVCSAGEALDAADSPEETATPQFIAPPPALSLGQAPETLSLTESTGAPSSTREAELEQGAALVTVNVRGLRTVPEALVRRQILSPLGETLDPAQVAEDARAIWALEVFEDVVVEAQPLEGGTALTFVVTERPLIGHLFIEGASSELAIARQARWMRGDVYTPGVVSRMLRRLQRLHRESGFLQATAQLRRRRQGDRVDVCLAIETGPAFKIRQLVFEGAMAIDEERLRSTMDTHHDRVNTEGGIYRADVFEADRVRMYALYYDQGHVNVTLGEARLDFDVEAGTLDVTIPIQEGPVFHLGRVTFDGDLRRPQRWYRRQVGLRRGQVFVRRQIMEGIGRIQTEERRAGRPNVVVEPAISYDGATAIVDVTFTVSAP